MLQCASCITNRAQVIRPKNGMKICKSCFIDAFESEIHTTIVENRLFRPGERIAVGASGGKDSTVLAAVLKALNTRYQYGVEFVLLSIDEGIHGYRDDSLETVKRNASQYNMELSIVGYDALYGWTMDQVVQKIGKKSNCTYCGVFRRQALDRAAERLNISHILTGHNADDIAETVIMNFLRGDLPRLGRCTEIVTASPTSTMKRSKPLKYAYEKEIVLYAHYRSLDYFSTECVYSPEAFRGNARALIKTLEKIRPSSILDIVRSGEQLAQINTFQRGMEGCHSLVPGIDKPPESASATGYWQDEQGEKERHIGMEERDAATEETQTSQILDVPVADSKLNELNGGRLSKGSYKQRVQKMGVCERCGYMSSQPVCKACVLVDSLNKGLASVEVGNTQMKN